MKRSAGAAMLLLAACSQQPANRNAAADIPAPAASETPSPAITASPASAATSAPAPSGKPGKLPPADRAVPRYIGRWAASERLCASGAWRFYATHLDTAGDISCSYDRVDKVSGGYDLHAKCTAEAPPVADLIKLRFAESAQAMLVESKTLKSAGLIYCGSLD